jgi:hypothetical protein
LDQLISISKSSQANEELSHTEPSPSVSPLSQGN